MKIFLQRILSASALCFLTLGLLVVSAKAATAAAASQKPKIYLVDPAIASTDISTIVVRGSGWGPYDQRQNARTWLIDPNDKTKRLPLTVQWNFRNCNKKGCTDPGDLWLELKIPQETKQVLVVPKKYGLFVETDNNLTDLSYITFLAPPPIDPSAKTPVVTLLPACGWFDDPIFIQGTGFTKHDNFDLRFDGTLIKASRIITPNSDNNIDNVFFIVPRQLQDPVYTTKSSAIFAPARTVIFGLHTVTLTNSVDISLDVPFTISPLCTASQATTTPTAPATATTTVQAPASQKQINKDRKIEAPIADQKLALEQERIKVGKLLADDLQQEADIKAQIAKALPGVDITSLKKDLKTVAGGIAKLNQKISDINKKIAAIDKKSNSLKTHFCSADLPITFQPGCVSVSPNPTPSPYAGRPCSSDLPITFQPGCVGQQPIQQVKLFAGKPCSDSLPLVWQEGCIPQPKAPTASPYVGKLCSSDLPITFQPGCISPRPMPPVKLYAGKPCNPELPRVWQEGCISSANKATSSANTTAGNTLRQSKKCNPNVPNYSQPGCVK